MRTPASAPASGGPRGELAALRARLADARRRAAEGGRLDLGDLAAQAERLCGRLTALPPAEGRRHGAELRGLIDDLDRLAVVLRAQAARGAAPG